MAKLFSFLWIQVMSVVRTMFTANLMNATQQQAAIRIVSDTQDLLGNQSLSILGRSTFTDN